MLAVRGLADARRQGLTQTPVQIPFPTIEDSAMTKRLPLLTLLLLAACTAPEAPAPEAAPEVAYLSSPEMESLNLPFSEAVRVGHLLFLSGQVGNEPGVMAVVPGGIGPETEQTMENIKATLERYGSGLDRVVKCTIFLADIDEWPAMNEVYRTYFPDHPPARSAVAGSGLALGARVEIECIATVETG